MYKKTLKRKIIKIIFPVLYHAKIHLISKLKYSGIGSILMFHRVCPEENKPRIQGNSGLEVTPNYLEQLIKYFFDEGYEFLSLDDVYRRLNQKKPGKKFLSLTFDDGYSDNYIHAFPILKKYNIPCTIYVSTNYPERKASPWWYALEDLLLKNESIEFELEQKVYKFSLESFPEKEDAFRNIRHLLMSGQGKDTIKRCNEFFSSFHIDLEQLALKMMMSWEQIIELSKFPIINIGAHTVNHFALNRLSEEEIKFEALESQKEIESKIQQKVYHFSYPFGSRDEVNEREFAVVKGCGFRTSTTTRWGNIFPKHADHLECLPRIHVNEKRDSKDVRLLSLSVNGTIPCFINKFKRVVTI
jgi:peptidoglycan/xylan/chitin deacetylase (PgdA/CDA1 family)